MKYNHKKILVLGCNSFVASHFIKYELKRNNEVFGISRSSNRRTKKSNHFRFVQADVNSKSILYLLDSFEPEIVINFAGQSIVQTSWSFPIDYFQTNIVGLSRIAHHLSESKYIEKFIQASTPEVYGDSNEIISESNSYNPSTPYALSKATFDNYLELLNKNYNFPYILVRASNWYGPDQQLFKIIPKTIIKIKKKENLLLDGNGISRRNFIYIDDAVKGLQKIIDDGQIGNIYHLATSEYVSISELVHKICYKMGYFYDELVKTTDERKGKDNDYRLDVSKITNELNWIPYIHLSEGLDKTIQWVNTNWNKIRNESIEYIYRK